MYISKESKIAVEERLLKVIKKSDFKILNGKFHFKETNINDFYMPNDAIAMIKDENVWSYLIPSKNKGEEHFKIFSFHFKKGMDNSGFVGWLASKIKEEFGSGIFVICGQNSNRGGIFDYWGCPYEISKDVIDYIKNLRA